MVAVTIFFNFFRRFARRWISRSDAIRVLLLFAFLLALGTFTFARLEGWKPLDALYATVITVTTVGYGDFSPQTGPGRFFATFFSLISVAIAGYVLTSFAANLIESRTRKKLKFLRKRRMKRIEQLKDHYILCGADLVAVRIAEEFYLENIPYIIIDTDEERIKELLLFSHPDYFEQKVQSIFDVSEVDLSEYEEKSLPEVAEMLDTAYILDDPLDDAALVRAGIDRAAGILAALPDQRDNIGIVVGAKALAKRYGNESLRVMARAEETRHVRKLYLAGADQVRIPAVSTGYEMANHMMHPELGNWWYKLTGKMKAHAPRMRQINVADYPKLVGMTVSALHARDNILTMTVKRGDTFMTPPPADLTLRSSDILVILSQQLP